MKNFFLIIVALLVLISNANSYSIGGAYARLISCDWGQWGYEYGNIGTYNVNGKIYQVFFGSNFCKY